MQNFKQKALKVFFLRRFLPEKSLEFLFSILHKQISQKSKKKLFRLINRQIDFI